MDILEKDWERLKKKRANKTWKNMENTAMSSNSSRHSSSISWLRSSAAAEPFQTPNKQPPCPVGHKTASSATVRGKTTEWDPQRRRNCTRMRHLGILRRHCCLQLLPVMAVCVSIICQEVLWSLTLLPLPLHSSSLLPCSDLLWLSFLLLVV